MSTTILKHIAYSLAIFICAIAVGGGCNKDVPEDKPKSITELIKEAHEAGKIVCNIKTLTDGWVIIFTDDSTLEITTSTKPEEVISSIVKDREWGVVKITMASGEVFIFKLSKEDRIPFFVICPKRF